MIECDIPVNYTIISKMSGVNLLVFIRLKLDNFVSIPKVLMPQLEVINVKYSSILHVVCFNIEVDQSVKVIVHGVNCAQVRKQALSTSTATTTKTRTSTATTIKTTTSKATTIETVEQNKETIYNVLSL